MGTINKNVLELLTFGFVIDFPKAQNYINTILDTTELKQNNESTSPSSTTFKNLLCGIVAKMIEEDSSGEEKVAISLSSGLDSRGILGALLESKEAKDITSITFGDAKHIDRSYLKGITRNTGIHQVFFDFNEYDWKLNELIDFCSKQYKQTGVLDSIQSIQTNSVAYKQRIGDKKIFHGYLGDSIAKPQYRTTYNVLDRSTKDWSTQAASFLKFNTQKVFDSPKSKELQKNFENFIEDNYVRLNYYPGLSTYDILNLGFRQGLRIRPDTSYMDNVLIPFEHKSYIDYWFQLSLEHRRDNSLYKKHLLQSFPKIFPEQHSLSLQRLMFFKNKVFNKFIGRMPELKGDPLLNTSIFTMYNSLIRSFDNRKLFKHSYQSDLTEWMGKNRNGASNRVKWIASVELHIQAGNLTT